MSVWEYIMPHRLLINKSLRRTAHELRDKVEEYQIEFERRRTECIEELQLIEEKRSQDIKNFTDLLNRELTEGYEALHEIQQNILQYISCYYDRAYLYQTLEVKRRMGDILNEDYTYLNNQINIINNEIKLLRERQKELSAFTSVDDIIQLATLTGYDFGFQPTDNAKQLLEKITSSIQIYSGEDRVEKYALLRLKQIIQERSDYLPAIQYISWVIRIKIQFKRQLLTKRSSIKKEQGSLRNEITSIKNEIHIQTDNIESLAESVRYYWAKPIAYLNADICYNSVELEKERTRQRDTAPGLRSELKDLFEKKKAILSEIQNKKRKRREVGSELRSMRDSHSSDQWRWDDLKREGESLTSDINSLSSDVDRYNSRIDSKKTELDFLESSVKAIEAIITSKKEDRKEWVSKGKQIIMLIRRCDIRFPSGQLIGEKDEKKIIDTRLSEIQHIRDAEVNRAQEAYRLEIEGIKRSHKEKVDKFKARMSELQTTLQTTDVELSTYAKMVTSAEISLEVSKKADTRTAIIKFFSESPAVTAAKQELAKARTFFATTNKSKESIVSAIDALKDEIKAEATNYSNQIEKCKPRYLRPTAEEECEEKKLMLRQKEIDQQSGGGRQ